MRTFSQSWLVPFDHVALFDAPPQLARAELGAVAAVAVAAAHLTLYLPPAERRRDELSSPPSAATSPSTSSMWPLMR